MRDLDFLPPLLLGEGGRGGEVSAAAHFEVPTPLANAESEREVEAWTEIEPGRFMPRRTRGSCVGRALG